MASLRPIMSRGMRRYEIYLPWAMKMFGFLCLLFILFYVVLNRNTTVTDAGTAKYWKFNGERKNSGGGRGDGGCGSGSGSGRTIDNNQRTESENLYAKGKYWKKASTLTHIDPSGFEKFVIFDSDGYSGSLEFLRGSPEGWSVFVVNNELESQIATCPGCLTFSNSLRASTVLERIHQQQKGMEKSSALPLSATNKMAASIFAIASNAPWVYVTDKRSPVPFYTLTSVIRDHPDKGMIYKGPDSIFQPCSHFMDTFTWNGKGLQKAQNRYVLSSLSPRSLYQIVDTCYRDGMEADWQDRMDLNAPIPFVMHRTLAAVDFNNILVPRGALWTLIASIRLTPTDTNRPFSTISTTNTTNAGLSLLTQRLLWETKNAIGFIPGVPDANSNSISSMSCATCDAMTSLKDVLSRDKESHISKALMNLTWCDKSVGGVEDCLNKAVQTGLMSRLNSNRENGKRVETLLSIWLKLLKTYRISVDERTNDTVNSEGNDIYFTPAKSLHQDENERGSRPPNIFQDVCAQNGAKYKARIPDYHPDTFNRIVMVISFNFARFTSSIKYLESMYGRHFKHIVYCSDGLSAFEENYLKQNQHNPVSFVDVRITSGYFGHHCLVAASEMNYYNVTGYLYLSDDVILNVWNLYNLPFHLPWFQTEILVVHLESSFTRGHAFGKDWYPWNQPTGKPAITKSIRLVKSLVNDTLVGERINWFLKNLRQMSSGCDNCIAYYDADVYYLPSYMVSEFRFFVPYFQGVFQELSVPTILSGITPQPDVSIYRLRGSYIFWEDRKKYETAWSEQELFIHPVKFSGLVEGDTKAKIFFCRIMRRTDQDLDRFEHNIKTNK